MLEVADLEDAVGVDPLVEFEQRLAPRRIGGVGVAEDEHGGGTVPTRIASSFDRADGAVRSDGTLSTQSVAKTPRRLRPHTGG
ncbi:hypothetical protein GCM10028856_34690 [Halopiger thermotolerans]